MNTSNADLNWEDYNLFVVDAEEIWRKIVHYWTNYMIMEMDAEIISVKSWLLWKLKVKQGF